jgi:hypothetical protein
MSKNELIQEIFKVRRAEKGCLITMHSNPRATVEQNHMEEFQRALGSVEKADDLIERFRGFNGGGIREKAMADGIIYTLIHQHSLGRVVLLNVLEIGTGRYKRIKQGKTRDVDYKRLNGLQVRLHNLIKDRGYKKGPYRNFIILYR